MVASCIVFKCSSRATTNQELSFYRIPTIVKNNKNCYNRNPQIIELTKKRQETWLRVLKLGDFSESKVKNARVCRKHFHLGKPADLFDIDSPDWAPCKDLGYTFGLALKRNSAMDLHERYKKRGWIVIRKSLIHETIRLHLSHTSALTTFQQLILTLMKLRLNNTFTDISYRFGIAESTVGRVFRRTLNILHQMFVNLIHWPDRETLQSTMPACFTNAFNNSVTCIVDCFEVFIETPSNMLSRALVFSHYKHHVTVKVFVVITGQGTISYVSEAWGGRTSDKHIVENSEFYDYILPGDVVLADRGFLIKDSLDLARAHLQIPAFTKGKKQLNPLDLENTRSIANVRIHVERVIGALRQKYTILEGIVPISMLRSNQLGVTIFDKILVVSCALYNLNPSIIPMS